MTARESPRTTASATASAPSSPRATIRTVDLLWSENGAVPIRSFRSLWEADAALARAFGTDPPPSGGGYDKTGFRIVWTDAMTHEGRVDVTPDLVAGAVGRGGILRAHVEDFARYLESDRHASFWQRHHGDRDAAGLAERQGWGRELRVRLDADRRAQDDGSTARNGSDRPTDPTDAATRPSYAGVGVPRLVAGRARAYPARVKLDIAGATLLPDPHARLEELFGRFMAVRGTHPRDAYSLLPAMRNVDGKDLANYVTLALRADLPTFERADAAVLWEQWRLAVKRIGASLRQAPDDTLMVTNLGDLEMRLYDLAAQLKRAGTSPGEVARAYCPWARDFFTQARLHPGGG